MSKLIIKNPCDESWDAMTPKGNGRHCTSCNKIVVDFSEMKSDEIKDYFKKVNGERVCGQFKSSQVEVIRPRHHLFLIQLYQKIETKFTIPFLRTISLYCVLLGLFLVGCKSKTTGEPLKHNSKKGTNKNSTQGVSIIQPTIGGSPLKKKGNVEVKCSVETGTDYSDGRTTVGMPIPLVVEPEIVDTFEIEKLKPFMLGKIANRDSVKK